MSRTSNMPSLVDDQEAKQIGVREQASGGSRGGRGLGDKVKLIGSLIAIAAAVGIAVYTMTGGPPDIGEQTRYVVVKDSETGELIQRFAFPKGERWPWTNGSTGKRTLYPVEACYWTKDGQVKLPPTYVILNSAMGKSEKTICPDCGREVRGNNPPPPPDMMAKALEAQGK
jgi:hypothetical protein